MLTWAYSALGLAAAVPLSSGEYLALSLRGGQMVSAIRQHVIDRFPGRLVSACVPCPLFPGEGGGGGVGRCAIMNGSRKGKLAKDDA